MIKDRNYSIVSCSPENLITKKGSEISTKPIAGTVKKTKNLNKSKALNYFRKNLKETKEHNMIVDMERNDLSRICKIGTVKLSKEKIVEENESKESLRNDNDAEQLFDQDTNEDEDFEIPAFLRRQKF